MVRNIWKQVVSGVLLAILLFMLWWLLKGKTYEARCVCAYWKSSVDTNAVGEVIQPKTDWQVGAYTDYRRVAKESLSEFFAEKAKSIPLFLDYLQSSADSQYDTASVSNAFASIRFKISGDPVAIIELSSKSRSKGLSLDVLRFTLRRYLAFVADNDRRREDKALALFKNDIELKRRNGEDASDLVARLAKAKVAVQVYRQQITIVKQPFIDW